MDLWQRTHMMRCQSDRHGSQNVEAQLARREGVRPPYVRAGRCTRAERALPRRHRRSTECKVPSGGMYGSGRIDRTTGDIDVLRRRGTSPTTPASRLIFSLSVLAESSAEPAKGLLGAARERRQLGSFRRTFPSSATECVVLGIEGPPRAATPHGPSQHQHSHKPDSGRRKRRAHRENIPFEPDHPVHPCPFP